MFTLNDTIAAVCTPRGNGALAAIRISGPESWEIAKKIFETASRKDFKHMQALHGYIKDNDKVIDEVVLLPYKYPHSYTSEDVIEIFCHGGEQVVSMILDLCLKNGARIAKNGEFTFRAFINGRIDLTEAEAVGEIINATCEKAVLSASQAVSGSLKLKIANFRERLFLLITSIEGSIEFPLDVEEITKNNIEANLSSLKDEIDSLIKTSKEGRVLRDGIKLSIVGPPNVGKSSLLNQLLESERAIVTDTPGTTRDTIEEKIILDGWPIVIIDTAGIRTHFTSKPECKGIERTKEAIKQSDLVLLVKDLVLQEASNGLLNEVNELIDSKSKIVIGNKVDLIPSNDYKDMKEAFACDVLISAKYGTNLDVLKKFIVEKIELLTQCTMRNAQSSACYINERQKELLIQASSSIEFALNVLNQGMPYDLISDELKKALAKLDEVTGSSINEVVIKNIFEKFCIGK